MSNSNSNSTSTPSIDQPPQSQSQSNEDDESTTPKLSPKSCLLYNEDVVQVTNEDGSITQAVVTRCWADEQNPEAIAEAKRLGIDFTPLRPGYLELLHPNGLRTETLESTVQLIDRNFLRGDTVRTARRSSQDPAKRPIGTQIGQIVAIESKVQLQRVLRDSNPSEEEKEFEERWYDVKDLVASARINRGDHVVYRDWVGVVEEVFEMAMIESQSGIVRRVCDVGTSLSVGKVTEAVQTMLSERMGGFFSNFLAASEFKTVLDVKQISVCINWLCRSRSKPSLSMMNDTEGWIRPKRYWIGSDMGDLKLVRATADHLRTIHDKLVFRDSSKAPPLVKPSSPYSSTYPNGFSTFTVTNCQSHVDVLWQDGTRTNGARSIDFEQSPITDDNETDVFPGDVGVHTSSDAGDRMGVVLSSNVRNRTIRLQYLSVSEDGKDFIPIDGKDGGIEVISSLEFDPHGPPPNSYGVRRSDWVLIGNETDLNGGGSTLAIPIVGENETNVGLMPDGEALRVEFSAIGLSFASNLSDSYLPPLPQTSPSQLSSITWYGEVWNLELDGRPTIRLPSGEFKTVGVTRLMQLDDGLDLEGHGLHHHDHDEEEEMMEMDEGEGDEFEIVSGDERRRGGGGDEENDGWITADEDDEEEEGEGWAADVTMELDGTKEEGRERIEMEEGENGRSWSEGGGGPAKERKRSREKGSGKGWADLEDDRRTTKEREVGSDAEVEESLVPGRGQVRVEEEGRKSEQQGSTTKVLMPGEIEDFADWSRFEVLEEAPEDHHYFAEKVQVPGKSFMSRVAKEHGVLATSLPPNILVRAYEDRSDLLRCLIIGPLGTPFQNAPFLFDLFLSPTKFPSEPPKVFFHSWAGGTRVSPNLYSEGKVCLSLLGTWSGEKIESWSAARSSILQILISIQGLIMVEDPYFTEPGFEKQMGTPEGTAASELYNERTLVLTRGFVRRACEYPPSSFVKEIAAYYYHGLPSNPPIPGALAAIIEQCQALLDESEEWIAKSTKMNSEEVNDDSESPKPPPQSQVVPSQRVITEGAGLSLKKTLKGLKELMQRGAKE